MHGLAGVVGGMVDAPHGAVCAALLAPVVEANVRALGERDPEAPALGRYTEVARLLTGQDDATVQRVLPRPMSGFRGGGLTFNPNPLQYALHAWAGPVVLDDSSSDANARALVAGGS